MLGYSVWILAWIKVPYFTSHLQTMRSWIFLIFEGNLRGSIMPFIFKAYKIVKLKCHNRFCKFQNLCVRICFLFQGRGEEGFDRSFDVRRKRFARRKTFRGRQVPWNHLEPYSRFVLLLPLILLLNTGPDKPLCRLGKVPKSYE